MHVAGERELSLLVLNRSQARNSNVRLNLSLLLRHCPQHKELQDSFLCNFVLFAVLLITRSVYFLEDGILSAISELLNRGAGVEPDTLRAKAACLSTRLLPPITDFADK